MELLILKIFLIFITIRIICLIVGHLYIVFSNDANELAVKEILDNPREYVRTDHMYKFMYDMLWLYIFVRLLWGVFFENLILK